MIAEIAFGVFAIYGAATGVYAILKRKNDVLRGLLIMFIAAATLIAGKIFNI